MRPPPPRRHRHIGGFGFCDPDDFCEDFLEVAAFVATESSGDVFPDHEPWSNKDACPSILSVTLSHLLYDPDLVQEQAAPLSVKPYSGTGAGKILTRRSSGYAIDHRQGVAAQFGNIAVVPHTQPSFFPHLWQKEWPRCTRPLHWGQWRTPSLFLAGVGTSNLSL